MRKFVSKIVPLSMSLTVALSSVSGSAQQATTSDPLFSRNTCAQSDYAGPCLGSFFGTLFETASDYAILYGDSKLFDQTSKLLKNSPTIMQVRYDAQAAVIKAKNIIASDKRTAMIDKIQNELSALKKAAKEGKDVKVTTLVDETDTPVFDARVTRRIAELKQDLAELRAADHERLPPNVRAAIQKSITRDAESLARLESAEPVEHIIRGSTTVSTSSKVIYNKDLEPAIKKMEAELATWENLPIVTAEAKAEQIALAELANSQTVTKMLSTAASRGLLRGAQIVEVAGAGLLLVDGGGRVLLFFTGYDPNISPFIKIAFGKKAHQEIFGK